MSLLDIVGGSLSGKLVFRNEFQILIGADVISMLDATAMFPPLNLISLHYEDPISFQADTLEISFPDIKDQIIKNSVIKKGVWIKVKINQYFRDYPGSFVQRDLGSFMIDQIKQIGPPSQTTIMASSVPIDQQIKMTLQNKTRLTTTLKTLVETVATENHLTPVWDVAANRDRPVAQAQQWNESDLTMLSRMLRTHALSMAIKDKKLIVFDEQDYEQKPAVYDIDFAKPNAGIDMIRWELTTQSQDIYSQSELAFYDEATNTVYYSRAKAPEETGSKETLKSYTEPLLAPGTPGADMSGDRGD